MWKASSHLADQPWSCDAPLGLPQVFFEAVLFERDDSSGFFGDGDALGTERAEA